MNILHQIVFNSDIIAFAMAWDGIKDAFAWFLEKIFELTLAMGVPSYALAILIFTIIVKLVLQPLMNKQLRSTHKMAKLQPQLQEIQKRYANNRAKMQEEQANLYKSKGVSPMAGCLPLLLQMPILIALYSTLRYFQPAPEYAAYFAFFWIHNLSQPDPTILMPILVGASTFLQQYVSMVNKQDKTQRMMLIIMPLMFIWFVRTFPAGLALYWVYYSLIGAALQYFFNRKWEKEDAIAEAAEAAAKEAGLEEKRSKRIEKQNKSGGKFKQPTTPQETQIIKVEKQVRKHPYSDEMETIVEEQLVNYTESKDKSQKTQKKEDLHKQK